MMAEIKAMKDDMDPGCYSYIAIASSNNLLGAGVAWTKKDRQALARLALALAAAGDIASEQFAQKVRRLEHTSMHKDFIDLVLEWRTLLGIPGRHDAQQPPLLADTSPDSRLFSYV